MSFDIWLGCFKNEEVAKFPLKIVEEAFGRFAQVIAHVVDKIGCMGAWNMSHVWTTA